MENTEFGQLSSVRVDEEVFMFDIEAFNYGLFSLPSWLNSIALSGAQVIYINFLLDGELVGKISGIVHKDSRILGNQLYFYAGPSLKECNELLFKACLLELVKFGKTNRFTKIYINSYDQKCSFKIDSKLFHNIERWEYIRDFSNEEIKPNKSFYYNIRKANKVNATFHQNNSDAVLNRFIELLNGVGTFRNAQIGKQYEAFPYPRLNKDRLRHLISAGVARLYHVEVDGVIHCVRASMEIGDKVYGLMIGADKFAYSNGLQQFLQNKVYEIYKQRNVSYFNLAGGIPGGNLAKYKMSMGFEERKVIGFYSAYLVFPYTVITRLGTVYKKIRTFKGVKRLF